MTSASPIRIARTPDGVLTYAVAVPPPALPAVRPRDLLAAWDMAREAAAAELWGPPRLLRFEGRDGEATTLAIADRDAAAWAEAIDARAGLATLPGLALCLRLLALVELLARAPALAGLYRIGPEGAEFHPALIAAAAAIPLDAGARFDAERLQGLISRSIPAEA
ncbi:hypothetical protein [Plastoroseomonas hellenica]|uniref:hypothetical protein n=1 Tax=Plastoroseomonas hellenica TaxID=2687306 RepID=UPI0034636C01